MDLGLTASLGALALIDSTSFGTLLIPLWLLLAPGRPSAGRIGLFLGTVAGFYLLLGVALAVGATTVTGRFGELADLTAARVVQYVVGVGLVVAGATMEPWTKAGKAKRAHRRAEREARDGPGRLTSWRARAIDGTAPASGVVVLALTAAAIEAASMLPYLAAIGLLAASDLSFGAVSAALVGYCVVMIAPALTLLAARLLLHERIAPTLAKLETWLTRNSREALAWVVFFVGLFVLADAHQALVGG